MERSEAAARSLLNSTVVRLTLVALGVLALAAAVIVTLVSRAVDQGLTQATEEIVLGDAGQLRHQFQSGGLDALAAAVAAKSSSETGGLFFLSDASGRKRAGNLVEAPSEIRGSDHAGVFRYRPAGASPQVGRLAAGVVISITDGSRLVVARDIQEQQTLLTSINRSLAVGLGAFTALGMAGGFLLARHILRRIDAMSRASQAIMAGNLAGRLPEAGSGDELDRLAAQLNAMLARIERLMHGLREVSDNIAHDLKTPLNRLRNSAEAALADQREAPAWREGLERTIEQADEIIKTFNALLLIARLEAGAVEDSLEPTDLAELARDVAELYEPVAEDRGFVLCIEAADAVPALVNRQLIGQAVANLIDNAIKYAAAADGTPPADGRIRVEAVAIGGEAELSVSDHGPGISEADRSRAVGRFVRLDASRTKPGTGLGLSLVAAVAQLHRGRLILADNAPGLRVALRLPLAPPAMAVASRSGAGDARNGREEGRGDGHS